MSTTITNITTLNQLVNNLRVIADNHIQIHNFLYGEPWEFYQSGCTNSPELWLACESVNREGASATVFNMNIVIADNVRRGEANELEVESDLIQIAEDIIAQLRHPHYGWNVRREDNIRISIRTERDPKNLTTVEFQLSVRVPKSDSRCAIPFSSNPVTT